MSKHTRGQFSVGSQYPHGLTSVLAAARGMPFIQIADCRATLQVTGSGAQEITQEEAEANACLFAAAPTLLAAAHSALALIRGSGFTDNTRAIVQLKAAIAKAEGRP